MLPVSSSRPTCRRLHAIPYVTVAVVAAIFCGPGGRAAAQTPSPASSPAPSAAPLTTIGTVTTAERYPSSLATTPQTTYVVSRAQIEANGYQTIADAIRNVPGMTFYQYGAFGAQASYGTLGSLRSIVLLNGSPITAGSSGEVDLDTLSSNDVERIEVVESGGSTLYGSGGAGGVINIITSVPRSVYLLASYGSFGDQAVRLAAGNGTVGVSFERHIATNDYPYLAQNGLPGGLRQDAQALQTDGSIEYAQTLGSWNLRASARLSQLNLGLPGPVAFAFGASELTPNEVDPSNRNDLLAKIAHVDGKFTTSFTVAGLHQAVYDNGNGFGPESSIVDSRTNASLEEVVRESDRNALVAGIDLSRESLLDVLGPFGPPVNFTAAQSQSAAYAQQTFGVGAGGTIYAGLRGENDRPAGAILEPALGFQFPVGEWRIAANGASSFIVPTLFDLYYPNFSNPNLLPERDRNLNVVISGNATALNPKLTLFDRTASDLITTGANFLPVNAGRAHFQGAVLSVGPRFGQTIVQLSVTDLPIATQVNNGVTGRIDYEPVFQSTISVQRPEGPGIGNIGYGVSAKIVGGHTESYAGPGLYGQYTTFDAYLRARLGPRAVLTARVMDVGNEYYETYFSYPMPARSYRLELSTR